MNANQRRHQNKVPVRSLSPGVLIALIALMAAMPWVYFKNQLVANGRVQRGLEEEIVALSARNSALDVQIATLSSRKALQKRLEEGVIAMLPVENHQIVNLNSRNPAQRIVRTAGEIQPVVNKEGSRR